MKEDLKAGLARDARGADRESVLWYYLAHLLQFEKSACS
jgi:hypothetical protein